MGLLALQGRGGARPGSPEQGIVFLGSRAVDGEVFTSWRGLICAVVCFSPRIKGEAGPSRRKVVIRSKTAVSSTPRRGG